MPGSVASASVAAVPSSPSSSPLARGTPCALPSGADAGAVGHVRCARFASAEDAFRAVLEATSPRVLAVGEAHAPKGSEGTASATKRFTDTLLPIVASRASDIVVELWAPDPRCREEVKAVASAQKPVTTAQAATNVNEYETLGVRAKSLGTTPWLLKPTCADFKAITEAGDDAVAVMLGLVESLTRARIETLLARNAAVAADAGVAELPRSIVLGYGGMMHNDLVPPPSTKPYAFGEELVRATGGRYVELDLVVPAFVRPTATWQALPWYEAHQAYGADAARATLYEVGDRSFVLVFANGP